MIKLGTSHYAKDLELRSQPKNYIKMGKRTVDLNKVDAIKKHINEILSKNLSIKDTKTLEKLCAYFNGLLQASININRLNMDIIFDSLSSEVSKVFNSIIID